MEEKKKILKWVCIGLVVTGGIALTVWAGPEIISILGAGATAVIPIFNKEDSSSTEMEAEERSEYEKLPEESTSEKRSYTNPVEPVNYSSCIVNLPENRQPSEEKIRTAAENGFTLSEGQTWRRNFTKYLPPKITNYCRNC